MLQIRTLIEQSVVYGILLVILALMILFGISAAERGVNSLVGYENPQALAVDSTNQGEVEVKILGKDLSTTQTPWADQVSDSLDQGDSSVSGALDGLAMNVGHWMQTGAQKVLDGISGWILGN